MATNTKNTNDLTWAPATVMGGKVHRTSATVGGDKWKFSIDQPRKGYWVARGWKNDLFAFHRDGTTLKAVKAAVRCHVTLLVAEDALAGMNHSAPEPDAVPVDSVSMRLADQVLAAAMSTGLPCDCQSPSHRMSCGFGGRVSVKGRAA